MLGEEARLLCRPLACALGCRPDDAGCTLTCVGLREFEEFVVIEADAAPLLPRLLRLLALRSRCNPSAAISQNAARGGASFNSCDAVRGRGYVSGAAAALGSRPCDVARCGGVEGALAIKSSDCLAK